MGHDAEWPRLQSFAPIQRSFFLAIHEVPELVSIVIPELRIAKTPYRILQIIHAGRSKC